MGNGSFFKQVNSDLVNHGATSFFAKIKTFFFDFNFGLLFSYRIMRRLKNSPFSKFNVIIGLWQNIIYNSYISSNAKISDNVKFAHAFGVIIGSAEIKSDVIIFQQVTIGSHGTIGKEMAWPTINSGTKIFSGAKVIGSVVIGANCNIGANCVIMKNIPDNAIIVSAPSKIIGYNEQ